MAVNDPEAYGVDIASIVDADALFSEAEGLAVVRQDAIHRLSTDNVLGPEGEGWGFNCARLLGMTATQVAAMPPVLTEVLLRDDRIEDAQVSLQVIDVGHGMRDIRITVSCITALGPFSFVKRASELTATDLEGADA